MDGSDSQRCAARAVIAMAAIAAGGLFLIVTNLGEPPAFDRLAVEAALFVPLLLCLTIRTRLRRR